ncbi:hypothetical protein RMSM_05244 [Rhodopirellula maiorica SM1]|uniref:Uncharacterized protein n=2 Tax=Novipirellula TaxID=2795426 RepID=M5RV67_9BACT|nr:hypothetical protein RMSM_05244 [Rhodopirellula maiorica SM1]
MDTTQIGAAGTDWRILVAIRFFDWIEENVKNASARYELMIAYHAWTKRGHFSINTGRVDGTHGSTTRKAIAKALVDCPYIELVRDAEIKKHAAIHRFCGLDSRSISGNPNQPTDSGLGGSSPGRRCRVVMLDATWLMTRAIRWCTWCAERNYEICCDFFGITKRAKAIFETFQKVTPPTNDKFLREISDEKNAETGLSKRDWSARLLRKMRDGSLLRVARNKSGRVYHSLTNTPRLMRKEMLIDGERMIEVDLKSAYWAVIAAQLPEGDEKDRMVAGVQSGHWYADLGNEAGVDFPTSDDLKVATQVQCLTGQDQRLDSRPLWVALRRRFPIAASMIQGIRDDVGASGLTHYLTRLEGSVMTPVHDRLIDMGIDFLPLHDAVLVPESAAERVADVIRAIGESILGFTPRVSVK